jgi:hypothetical protein
MAFNALEDVRLLHHAVQANDPQTAEVTHLGVALAGRRFAAAKVVP